MPAPPPALDLALFTAVNETARSPLLDWLMPLASSKQMLAVGLGLPLAIELLRLLGRAQSSGRTAPRAIRILAPVLLLLAGLAASDAACHLVKESVGRIRPLNAMAGVHYIEDGRWQQRPADFAPTKKHGSSFPSAHAANTACLAVLAMLLWRQARPWAVLLPLLTGYSRLYLGKHWPSDVLAGWILGSLVALVLWRLWQRLGLPAGLAARRNL